MCFCIFQTGRGYVSLFHGTRGRVKYFFFTHLDILQGPPCLSVDLHSYKNVYTTCWSNLNKIVRFELHGILSFLIKTLL